MELKYVGKLSMEVTKTWQFLQRPFSKVVNELLAMAEMHLGGYLFALSRIPGIASNLPKQLLT